MPKKYYEFREGNGNDGNYFRYVFNARNIENALRIVRRKGLKLSAYNKRKLVLDWDEQYAYLTVHSNGEFGYAPYTAEIREISKEDYEYGLKRSW